jgi:plasmid stability protein
MARLSAVKRPAVEAASAKLLTLGDWVREKDAKRTFGKVAQRIMEASGYVVDAKDVKTSVDPLFRKGARYKLRTPAQQGPDCTTVVLRDVDAEISSRLRDRARRSGRSPEAEALLILADVLLSDSGNSEPNLAEAIHRRFAALGGADDLVPHPPVTTDAPPTIEP